MRFDILALAIIGLSIIMLPAAADPSPATPSEHDATPAATKAAAPQLSKEEQRLINLGYKPQMRNGEKVYCRREAPLGSRISASAHCGTVSQLAASTQDSKDYLQKTQQNQLNPVGH